MNKKSISDLAVFGGRPLFDEALHVGRPNIGNRKKFEERVRDVLDRKWLTNEGRYVKEFESLIAGYINVNHCIAMCNGTVALEIAIRALGLKGEVILPSFTFIATAHALQWQEITPVFCDIDPRTHNIDPGRVEKMITPRTTGIIGVHVWGRGCEMEALNKIAEKHGLKLLFDAAHAFGCSSNGRMIGNFGDAEVFSFHATKYVNSLEGGAIVTNNSELDKKIRLMKNFGFTFLDRTDYIGMNGKMNEISAAMGITNLESMDEFIDVNYRNYCRYHDELSGIPGIDIVKFNGKEKQNYQYVVLEIDEEKTGIDRDRLMVILHAENILARRYFYPGCHRMEPYRSYFPHAGLLLPKTEKLAKRVLCLPTGASVSISQIENICKLVKFVLKNSEKICSKMDVYVRKN